MGAVMGTFSSLQTKQRRPSKGKISCFAFLASSVYFLGEKMYIGKGGENEHVPLASSPAVFMWGVICRGEASGMWGGGGNEWVWGYCCGGALGVKTIRNLVILHPGMYEEEKLSGSICRALAEETCLFPNPMLCKSTEEGITCSYTANPSRYRVVSFCESIVRGDVVYSVIQQQVCSANDVCFMKIVKRKKY